MLLNAQFDIFIDSTKSYLLARIVYCIGAWF